MTRFNYIVFLLITVASLFSATTAKAQITSPEADNFTKVTNDTAYIFCTTKDKAAIGTLTAVTPNGMSSTFIWEKFDTITGVFAPFTGFIEYEDTLSSTISRLDDGLYRVSIKSGGMVFPSYQAYVLNNWIEITKTEIPDSTSTCDGFLILGDFENAPLRYYDTLTNSMKGLRNIYIPFLYEWEGNGWTAKELNHYFPSIASEKPVEFKLTITDDQFTGCKAEATVLYDSKIPKSDFKADPMKGEAVLKVTFSNESINYDSVMWHFYKADSIIKMEIAENKDVPVDSIDFILYDTAPVYEFEWCGLYKVKLVSVKVNPTTGNCYDTLHIEGNIEVENALVKAPNVFTPNGDGANDNFVVQTLSLKSMSIQIYNRWGGSVHSWSYSNIRGRDYTYKHSVWDGRIGGRMASPGVYFYVIRAVGRDGSKQNIEGFLHLFRDKIN